MAELSKLGILDFQQKVKGGVRPNLFQVYHEFPEKAKPTDEKLESYLCKSAALPASTVGTVELPFRGRVLKVPGDRTFESWTATFYMDDAFDLRGAYERWIDLTNRVDVNRSDAPLTATGTGATLQDINILQLDKFGEKAGASGLSTIREYKLIGAFPVSVSQISLAYDNNDSYEEFDVEFAYQFFTTGGGNGNNLIEKVSD
jgi:hypothetical protein